MTPDTMPPDPSSNRRRIEMNLAASLLMQLGEPTHDLADRLPAYPLAGTAGERAAASAARVMAAVGLTTDDEDGVACQESLLAWFAQHDAEVDED